MEQVKLDALDLTISAMKAHEKRFDELLHELVQLIMDLKKYIENLKAS